MRALASGRRAVRVSPTEPISHPRGTRPRHTPEALCESAHPRPHGLAGRPLRRRPGRRRALLELFGDVATELCIRLDGDEGLFRAYDTVEFLAPVFAGDYIEAEGEIVGSATTSRQHGVRGAQGDRPRARRRPTSAADVLAEPMVVCARRRAPASCPRTSSAGRWPRDGRAPCVITAAIVGAETTREQTPHLPHHRRRRSARRRARCREAGAAVIHLHVRDARRHAVAGRASASARPSRAIRARTRRHHPDLDRRRGRHERRRALRQLARPRDARDGDAQRAAPSTSATTCS